MKNLKSYFVDGVESSTMESIGAEVETQFVDKAGEAITVDTSQKMLKYLSVKDWKVEKQKGDLITGLVDSEENRICYELGRHNIEVSTLATSLDKVLGVTRTCLNQLYTAGEKFGAVPYFEPILKRNEDLLVIPDERDATWLELDGREALALLARISSVQFTFSVSSKDSIDILNKFGRSIDRFLVDYPQDSVWKSYISDSLADYKTDRYGGPLVFDSIDGYCLKLAGNSVVQGTRLVPYSEVEELDIPLFLRSIWWYFRLKRYGKSLCVEVRPMARYKDEMFESQLERVLSIVNG